MELTSTIYDVTGGAGHFVSSTCSGDSYVAAGVIYNVCLSLHLTHPICRSSVRLDGTPVEPVPTYPSVGQHCSVRTWRRPATTTNAIKRCYTNGATLASGASINCCSDMIQYGTGGVTYTTFGYPGGCVYAWYYVNIGAIIGMLGGMSIFSIVELFFICGQMTFVMITNRGY